MYNCLEPLMWVMHSMSYRSCPTKYPRMHHDYISNTTCPYIEIVLVIVLALFFNLLFYNMLYLDPI